MKYVADYEYYKLKNIMVGKQHAYDKCTLDCKICPLNAKHNHKEMSCHGFEKFYPDEALTAVVSFMKENTKLYPDFMS